MKAVLIITVVTQDVYHNQPCLYVCTRPRPRTHSHIRTHTSASTLDVSGGWYLGVCIVIIIGYKY